MTRHKRRHFKPKSIYLWHRYLGLAAAVLVFILSVTGLVLNRTEMLNLDSRYIRSDLVLDWYGIEASQGASAYKVGESYISQFAESLYVDQHKVPGGYMPMVGAVGLGPIIAIGLPDTVLLLTRKGRVIDRVMIRQNMPGELTAMGLGARGTLLVRAGDAVYRADADLLQWSSWQGNRAIKWATPTVLPAALGDQLQREQRYNILPLERVMLDLHSGRFFGRYGVYVMDAAAIILLLLAASGVWLWWQQNRKRRQHRKHQLKLGVRA